ILPAASPGIGGFYSDAALIARGVAFAQGLGGWGDGVSFLLIYRRKRCMVQPSYFWSLVRQVAQGRSTRPPAASWKHGVEWLEQRQLLDSGPTALSKLAGIDPARFVTGLYKDLLERPPQSAEISQWTNALAAGATPDQVVWEFISSPEYRMNGIPANYSKPLKRQARPDEVEKWLQDLGPGDDEKLARAKLVASTIYTGDQMRDSLTWLANVYEDILGRPPDLAGSNSWSNALAHGA